MVLELPKSYRITLSCIKKGTFRSDVFKKEFLTQISIGQRKEAKKLPTTWPSFHRSPRRDVKR